LEKKRRSGGRVSSFSETNDESLTFYLTDLRIFPVRLFISAHFREIPLLVSVVDGFCCAHGFWREAGPRWPSAAAVETMWALGRLLYGSLR
jgi:hypothetical protein